MLHSNKAVAFAAVALLTGAALTLAMPDWAGAQQQQMRFSLVRSVDEPGLNPYQEEVIAGCTSVPCQIQFPAVPAGKRLVVKHVSINAAVSLALVARLGSSDPDAASVALAGAESSGGTGEVVLSQLVHYVVPSGLNPVIQSNAGDKVRATVVGYLITP
jgi:hypothetical protein